MGTPQFAVASLEQIYNSNHTIVGVVTATDKPAGRGQKLMPSPVKQFAMSKGLFLMQPEKLKAQSFLESLAVLNADIFVVVAFRMLPDVVWKMPKMGTVNVHASLLPQYRGAAPINWALINGETVTGVTTFFIEQKMDMGNIIAQKSVNITNNMNAGQLHDVLMNEGALLLLETIDAIESGTASSIAQHQFETTVLKEAFKIYKETCIIDWKKCSQTIHNLIRGMAPYPAAQTHVFINGEKFLVKIFEAQPVFLEQQLEVGEVFTDEKKFLYVGCNNGAISILSLQLAGKSRLAIAAFLNGVKNKSLFFQ